MSSTVGVFVATIDCHCVGTMSTFDCHDEQHDDPRYSAATIHSMMSMTPGKQAINVVRRRQGATLARRPQWRTMTAAGGKVLYASAAHRCTMEWNGQARWPISPSNVVTLRHAPYAPPVHTTRGITLPAASPPTRPSLRHVHALTLGPALRAEYSGSSPHGRLASVAPCRRRTTLIACFPWGCAPLVCAWCAWFSVSCRHGGSCCVHC